MKNYDTANIYDSSLDSDQFERASINTRIVAFLIDHFIFTFVLLTPFILFSFTRMQSESVFVNFPLLILASCFVYGFKDGVKGNSPGKYMLGIAVRNSSEPSELPSLSKLFIRNILTFAWPIEFICLAFSESKTKIGDRIAGTNVYRVSRKPKTSVILTTIILSFTIFITSMVFGVSAIIKNDTSYKTAIDYIEGSPEIALIVGTIEGYGFIPNGSVNYSGGFGQARFSIRVKGSKGNISVHIVMEKKPESEWEIIDLDFEE